MSNRQDGTVGELFPDRGLYQGISLKINGGCCLIQNEDFCFSKQSTSKTDKLPLSNAVKKKKKGKIILTVDFTVTCFLF